MRIFSRDRDTGRENGGRVRLLVLSAVTLVRAGLSAAVAAEPDLSLAGCTGSVAQARAACASGEVDVVLVESDHTGRDPLAVATELRGCRAGPAVVLLGPARNPRIVDALTAGISGYVPADATVDQLLATVRRAAAVPAGFTAPELATVLRAWRTPHQRLSPREGEVLRHLRDGASLASIAGALLVSESTVKTYATRIYDKLGVRNRAQAVEVAARSGILP
jgi:DNA-binding NarL/FixJ family response regulator